MTNNAPANAPLGHVTKWSRPTLSKLDNYLAHGVLPDPGKIVTHPSLALQDLYEKARTAVDPFMCQLMIEANKEDDEQENFIAPRIKL